MNEGAQAVLGDAESAQAGRRASANMPAGHLPTVASLGFV